MNLKLFTAMTFMAGYVTVSRKGLLFAQNNTLSNKVEFMIGG